MFILEPNACDPNPCNAANSECKEKRNGDYKCDCKEGFKQVEGSDKKLCEGNVLNNFKTFSFRTDEGSTGAPQEVQYCQVIDILYWV